MISQADFARLVGVKRSMVTKYKKSGLLVIDGGKVDAHASLMALDGTLDERKRLDALAALAAGEDAPTAASAPEATAGSANRAEHEAGDGGVTPDAVAGPTKPAPVAPAAKPATAPTGELYDTKLTSTKIDLKQRALNYARDAGDLVDKNAEALKLKAAIRTVLTELDLRVFEDADRISTKLGLNSQQAHALRYALRERDYEMRADLERALREIARNPRAARVA